MLQKDRHVLILLLTPYMKCFSDISCLRISVDREEIIGRMNKGITMTQGELSSEQLLHK